MTMPAMSTKVTVAGTIFSVCTSSASTEGACPAAERCGVRLDGGERVVFGEDIIARQRVEHGGLATFGRPTIPIVRDIVSSIGVKVDVGRADDAIRCSESFSIAKVRVSRSANEHEHRILPGI